MRRRHERGRAGVLAAVMIVAAGCAPPSGTSSTAAAQASPSNTLTDTRPSMQITRAGTQPSGKGPTDWFTGTVRIDPLFTAPAPARAVGAAVTFEPGARTAWHTHPLGQTLVVLSGVGRVQTEGEPVAEIRPGDVVWIPPGERHWHGASPTTAMTHIAIQEAIDGKMVEWLEHVTDEQYRGARD
jgi:quercetin dioxygenase-like cupin family protein